MKHKIIREIALSVIAAGGADNIIKGLAESTARDMEAKGCSLLILQQDGRQMAARVSYGIEDDRLCEGQLLADDALKQVLKGNPLFVWDASGDPRMMLKE